MSAKFKLKGIGNVNTTTGVIWKQLLLFALPLLFSNFLQQLYNAIDLLIVGNFSTDTALGAVGSTGAVTGLLVGMFIGISTGASVVVSHAYGAEDNRKVYEHVHSTMFLGLVSGIIMMVIGLLASRPLLVLMNTPDVLLPEAAQYMQIIFIGMIPTAIYNMASGILRAVGDSKRPLIFLIIAAITNLVLDLLFVAVLDFGVAGAGWATVISQALSAVLSVATLMRSETNYRYFIEETKPHKESVKQILQIGIPAGMQSVIINLANTIIQTNINAYGPYAVEGYTAAGRIDGFLYMCINSISLAIMTFVGQNIGAGKYDRVRKGIKVALGLACGIAAGLGLIIYIFRDPLLRMFGTNDLSLPTGETMLTIAASGYWIFAIGDVLSGAFRGAGKATFPMVSSMINMFGVRLIWVYVAQLIYPEVVSVLLAFPVSWIAQAIMMLIFLFRADWLPAEKAPDKEASEEIYV